MSLQFSGGPYINRLVPITTKQDLVNGITQALFDASWTTIGGTPGSGTDVIQESRANNNNGCKIRIRNSTVSPSNISSYHTLKDPLVALPDGSGLFCSAAALTWRIIANPYTFYAWQSGSATNAVRGTLYAGTLWVPPWISYLNGQACGWMTGSGPSDAYSGGLVGWRDRVRAQNGNWAGCVMFGTTQWNDSSGGGWLGLCPWEGGPYSADQGYRWEDGSSQIYEPILTAPIGNSTGNEQKMKGIIYDACMIAGSWSQETLLTIDGRNYMVVTHNPQTNNAMLCALAVVVP